jgi:hypothetical protein
MAPLLPKKRAPMMLLAACALGASPLASCSADDSFQDGADAAFGDVAIGDVVITDVSMNVEGNIFPSYDSAADANTDDVVDASSADAADE